MSRMFPFRAAMVMQFESKPGPIAAEHTYSVAVVSTRIFALDCGAGPRVLLSRWNADADSLTVGDATVGETGTEPDEY